MTSAKALPQFVRDMRIAAKGWRGREFISSVWLVSCIPTVGSPIFSIPCEPSSRTVGESSLSKKSDEPWRNLKPSRGSQAQETLGEQTPPLAKTLNVDSARLLSPEWAWGWLQFR